MNLIERIVAWLDTWNEYPSHAWTLIIVAVVLASLAIAFALITT
jgi:hypothetical protein